MNRPPIEEHLRDISLLRLYLYDNDALDQWLDRYQVLVAYAIELERKLARDWEANVQEIGGDDLMAKAIEDLSDAVEQALKGGSDG